MNEYSMFYVSFHQLLDILIVSTLGYCEYCCMNICVQVFMDIHFHFSCVYT